jgi:hypothetical protein
MVIEQRKKIKKAATFLFNGEVNASHLDGKGVWGRDGAGGAVG